MAAGRRLGATGGPSSGMSRLGIGMGNGGSGGLR